MKPVDMSAARWRKSIRSSATGNCVEVATNTPSILVRDTKDQGTGPILAFSSAPRRLNHRENAYQQLNDGEAYMYSEQKAIGW